MLLENKQRMVFALLFMVCLYLLVLTPGAAQLKKQKHVTSIQLGGAAEGSRVTVVSDSPLVDYEAFRRGDRFYVRVPLADMSSAAPHLRADGFEDVQVQKVGDGLIVSFKLQAGATARVDQRGNRLDVIFSAANRSSANNAARSGSRVNVASGSDAAGPMPPDPGSASRPRVARDRGPGLVNESRAPGDPRWQPRLKPNANKNSNKTGNHQLTAQLPVASPSPLSSPSAIPSPGNLASYTPLTASTPPASPSSTPAAAAGSSNSQSWRNRVAAARYWMSRNRLATLLAALILLSLIVYLVSALKRRQKTKGKTRRATAPKVQPKYSEDAGLNELPKAGIKEPVPQRDTAAEAAASRPPTAAPDYERPRILTRPTIVSPSADHEAHSSEEEEEEREVFEL